MAELMNREEFRTALENAIKGKSANQAPSARPGPAAN
jgi:pyrroloquinoline-quinone synthase